MQFQPVNPEEHIVHVALSIETDPNSWKGWSALHVTVGNNNAKNLQGGWRAEAESVIESWFKTVEGKIYFCNPGNIFIIGKFIPQAVLKHACEELQNLFSPKNDHDGRRAGIYYDLKNEGMAFAETILKNVDKSIVPTSCGIDRVIAEALDKLDCDREHDSEKDKKPVKILVVEDDPVTSWMIGNILKDECEVTAVENADRAFSVYDSYRPDIVLLDIGLPDRNGIEVLSWIMRNDPSARVLMLSCQDDVDNITNCIENGARGFIAKPLVKENLLHYIHKYG